LDAITHEIMQVNSIVFVYFTEFKFKRKLQ